eukprot:1144597-Amphidinium_carterae.1
MRTDIHFNQEIFYGRIAWLVLTFSAAVTFNLKRIALLLEVAMVEGCEGVQELGQICVAASDAKMHRAL